MHLRLVIGSIGWYFQSATRHGSTIQASQASESRSPPSSIVPPAYFIVSGGQAACNDAAGDDEHDSPASAWK